jgi:hypothetical protein
MQRIIVTVCIFVCCSITESDGQENFDKDIIPVSGGNLEVTFIGHGILILPLTARLFMSIHTARLPIITNSQVREISWETVRGETPVVVRKIHPKGLSLLCVQPQA